MWSLYQAARSDVVGSVDKVSKHSCHCSMGNQLLLIWFNLAWSWWERLESAYICKNPITCRRPNTLRHYRHYYLGNLWQGHVHVLYWEAFTSRWPSLWTSNFGRSSAWRHCKPGFTRTYAAFTLLLPWLVPSSGGRRYGCWLASSSIMSCLLWCRLSAPLLVTSLLHASVKSRKSFVRTVTPLDSSASSSRLGFWKDSLTDVPASVKMGLEVAESLPVGSGEDWLWLRTGVGRAKTVMRRWGYLDDAQSVDCDCGESQTMAHLLSYRLLDEACTADDLATVTQACARKWEKIIVWRTRKKKYTHLSILGLAAFTRLQIPCVHDTHTMLPLWHWPTCWS